MYVVHVIPIARGIGKEQLSYFSQHKISRGSLVNIPLRNRLVSGVVIDIEAARDVKARIKDANYVIKRVESFNERHVFLPSFMQAASRLALHHASSTGAVLHQLIPKTLLASLDKMAPLIPEFDTPPKQTKNERLVFQADYEMRVLQYRNIIRESFAHKHSVFACVATIHEAEQLAERLKKGIEPYVFVLHSGLQKRELLNRVTVAVSSPHPVLIVLTGSFLSTPRFDVRTIIIDQETSRGFKQTTRPFIDIRTYAILFAEELGARIILADTPLRIETLWRYDQGEFDELTKIKQRAESEADQMIIDMRPAITRSATYRFSTLSSELKNIIEQEQKKGERIFIFNARRGLAPTTVCEDCGVIVLCASCSSPVVLHQNENKNVFVCHKCGTVRSAKECCSACTSWKLKPLGVGIERVANEIQENFPDRKVFIASSDVIKTRPELQTLIEKFYQTDSGILIGTELTLPYLTEPIEYTAVSSVESLLSLPDPLVHERVFIALIKLRSLAKKTFLVQTRQPDSPLITHAIQGNISAFYKNEINQRKQFEYPPFVLLIKITATGTYEKVSADMEELERLFKNYSFRVYPAFIPVAKNQYAVHAIIRVPRSEWPDTQLLRLLYGLSPHLTINVDPQSTL